MKPKRVKSIPSERQRLPCALDRAESICHRDGALAGNQRCGAATVRERGSRTSRSRYRPGSALIGADLLLPKNKEDLFRACLEAAVYDAMETYAAIRARTDPVESINGWFTPISRMPGDLEHGQGDGRLCRLAASAADRQSAD
jgi:hypothetical protein